MHAMVTGSRPSTPLTYAALSRISPSPRDRLWSTSNTVEKALVKTNLTIQLDAEVVRRAKVLAAKRGTSVSGMVARELEELMAEDERYEAARERARELMVNPQPLGGRNWTRDDIYSERLDRFSR